MSRIILCIFAFSSLIGCATINNLTTAKPVSGSSSSELRLPDIRTLDSARNDIRSRVQNIMYDKAAEVFRDKELSTISENALLSLPDTDETRLNLVRRAVEEQISTAIRERNSDIFTMTRWIPYNHTANGDILDFDFKLDPISKASKGVYSGTFNIGRKYCYSSREVGRYCDDKEIYKVALNGTYSVGTTSLELTYNASQIDHDGSLGLSSKLRLEPLSLEMSRLATSTVNAAHNEVDNRYKNLVNGAVATITGRLERRVISRPVEVATIGESTFQLGFETAMARLQRRLDKFKYDKDNSTFVFDLDRHEETWYGKKVPMREQITVKLFPEKNNTVVVYKLEYLPVYDDLADKNLYTVADAKARVNAIIAQVESNLKK
jgi:hypothetical protein